MDVMTQAMNAGLLGGLLLGLGLFGAMMLARFAQKKAREKELREGLSEEGKAYVAKHGSIWP